jgi:hypothetical protein
MPATSNVSAALDVAAGRHGDAAIAPAGFQEHADVTTLAALVGEMVAGADRDGVLRTDAGPFDDADARAVSVCVALGADERDGVAVAVAARVPRDDADALAVLGADSVTRGDGVGSALDVAVDEREPDGDELALTAAESDGDTVGDGVMESVSVPLDESDARADAQPLTDGERETLARPDALDEPDALTAAEAAAERVAALGDAEADAAALPDAPAMDGVADTVLEPLDVRAGESVVVTESVSVAVADTLGEPESVVAHSPAAMTICPHMADEFVDMQRGSPPSPGVLHQ